jgi:hypothetical protein
MSQSSKQKIFRQQMIKMNPHPTLEKNDCPVCGRAHYGPAATFNAFGETIEIGLKIGFKSVQRYEKWRFNNCGHTAVYDRLVNQWQEVTPKKDTAP